MSCILKNRSLKAWFFIFAFAPLLFMGCPSGQENVYPGVSSVYPYYSEADLANTYPTIDVLISRPDLDAKYLALKKVFVFPIKSRRYSVVTFANDFLNALEQDGWKVLDSDTEILNEDPLVDIERATGVKDPDVVAFYMTDFSEDSYYFYRTWKLLAQQKFLKVSILEDFNYRPNLDNTAYFNLNADLILVRYPEAFAKVAPDRRVPVFHFPHSAAPAYFDAHTEFNDKKLQMLLSGAINKEWYALRAKALELYNNDDERVVFRKHPGYQPNIDPVKESKEYSAFISSHVLALAGAGMGVTLPAPYILGKTFEIAATGTVLVTDKFVAPLMNRLGFVEGIHYLGTTPETLENDLRKWLRAENKGRLEAIGLAGRQLILERHTLAQRMVEFKTVVMDAWQKKNTQCQ